MIKFLTAMVNSAGEVVGCVTGDMPLAEGFFWEGCSFVSVAAVVAKESHQQNLPHQWRRTLRVQEGRVVVDDRAREFVNTVIATPSTAVGLASAETLSPLIAHWLKRCSGPDAERDERIEAAISEHPQLADVVESLYARRHTPHVKSAFQKFDARVKAIQTATNAQSSLREPE